MKKLINDPRAVVRELLEGVVDMSAADLALLEDENVVIRRSLPPPAQRQVAIISGGGSGHEPAHAGYVGAGLLSAAVAGDVFTSPSTDAVLAAIRAVAGPAGALLIVKNYTGDRLNFGLAAELAKQQGIPVELAIVADDVSLKDVVPRERRRGIAGTVLIHKLAGAAAEAGKPLGAVADIARRAARDLGSMGIGLGACVVPAAGVPGFELGADQIEFGLGIHGEKGVERTTMLPADAIVARLLEAIMLDLKLSPGARVAVLINGLGGTSAMELAIVARAALADLRRNGIEIGRAWAGNYLSAMEMPGVSLSLLPLDPEREALFDAPTQASAWPTSGRIAATRPIVPSTSVSDPAEPVSGAAPLSPQLLAVATTIADALDRAEVQLTDLDAKAGDGDLGASMQRGADALRRVAALPHVSPASFLAALGNAVRRAIAGSSGPFYATGLLRAAQVLRDKPQPSAADWVEAFAAAVASVGELGGAKAGDRTMLDALLPALEAARKGIAENAEPATTLDNIAAAARAGAEDTADMLPMLGRSSYLGRRVLGTPDGGAVAVAIWLQAISAAIL